MSSILQWGKRVSGKSAGEYSRVRLLQQFPTRQESSSLAFTRLSTSADNSELLVVRAALDFTKYSNTSFSVVAAAVRASK